jgi:hypothetical protein
MANISRSRILFFVTSPRSPIKIVEELALLHKFESKKWNQATQEEYAQLLSSEIETFKPKKDYKSFTARDRVNRAPKSLGFVDLTPVIKITPAGKDFLTEDRENIFLKQLLKFQLPSPYHQDNTNRFNVKPFLEVIRLIRDLDGLSKTELQIFGLQITDFSMYEEVKKRIDGFRKQRLQLKTGRREFVIQTTKREFSRLYHVELRTGKVKIRADTESLDETKFLKTKIRNARDYADACFRYLLLTGLFNFDLKRNYLEVKESRRKEVEFILSSVPRPAIIFVRLGDFKTYLFNSVQPILYWDIPKNIIPELNRLKVSFDAKATTAELKTILRISWKKNYQTTVSKEISTLVEKNDLDEILSVYDAIIEENSDMIEPNLFLEWNTWRALVVLDDGVIQGNFIRDTDGYPVSTALGKQPDILCKYTDFGLIVEVTRSTGERQFATEGEPVPRHLGKVRIGSKNPIYGLFIPIKLNSSTLAHFYSLLRQNIPYYGGCAEIIPMELTHFIALLRKAGGKVNSSQLKIFVENLIKIGKESKTPEDWYLEIQATCEKGFET